MPVLGITGGIATGKSTFTRALLEVLPAEVFDADLAARSLLESDAWVRESVAAAFGDEIYPADGAPDRIRLRELIYSDPANRTRLEQILHPAVRAGWIARGEAARRTGAWLLIDIPLLYETAAEVHLDRVIVVGCSPQTQRHRLRSDRALPLELAERIIAAQLDLPTKIKRADHLIWNDSRPDCLKAQAEILSNWLTRHYG